ncbi:hypothetical protein Poly24_09580 [Rosistilla carotiformis]|uniref:Cytochrome c domain-containing protein n=1 Tax=Rosistilla carotiformis TaxID=2528017 RepID=A0A518JNZ2_9BACT|nr:hypothetical protein [Rosistilla carotiformis]QDV67265.1 hypothetical protein Poly24_09580 [Rosistilla carotiformis]
MRQSDKPLPQPLPQPPRDDRPGDNWVCGWSDAGTPCQHGPSGKGDCPALAACRPFANGDSWSCNRPACLGGKCDSGPDQEGVCGLQPTPCTPKRSWKAKRRMATSLCFLSAVSMILLSLGGRWRTEAFAPGGLIQPHAQILGGELKSDRCASCHPAAKGSLTSWFFSAGDAHQNVTQTQLCMDCHHNTIDRNLSRNAHNLSSEQLQLVSLSQTEQKSGWHAMLPSAAVTNDDIACATCHREHHGSEHSLSALTSQQCQTCHKNQFSSFTHGHPQWTDWPYGRSGKIAFNHASHAGKHFAQENATFDCKRCHQQTADQELGRTASFEVACASCHDKSLKVGIAEGFAIVQFPMLDTEAMRRGGHPAGAWPADATGIFDGKIPPVVRLLLRSDADVATALDRLPADGDLSRLDSNSANDLADAKTIAAGVRRLMNEMADSGYDAIAKRLSLATGLDMQTTGQLAAKLSPQLIEAACKNWLPEENSMVVIPPALRAMQIQLVADWEIVPENPLRVQLAIPHQVPPAQRIAQVPELLQGQPSTAPLQPAAPPAALQAPSQLALAPVTPDDPLSQPLADALSDPLNDPLSDPLAGAAPASPAPARPKRFDATKRLPAGGWYSDSLRLAVRYQPSGHADQMLVALVGLANSAKSIHPSDYEAIMSMQTVKACVRCHQTARADSLASWRAAPEHGPSKTFTRFSHRPHMNLPMLMDCKYCHQVAGKGEENAVQNVSTGESHPDHDFGPLTLDACAKCHTAQAAGDQCTKCHLYHVDSKQFAIEQLADHLKSSDR